MSVKSRFPGRSRVLTAIGAAATLLVASACGSGGTDSSEGGNGELSIAIQAPPGSFELAQLDGGQSSYLWSSLYDTLLYTDNKGQIQPNAGESHSYSGDRETLTLKLRKGMTFRSGTPVDAAAVKASLDHIRTTPGPNQAGLASIASVGTPDESTVAIKLKHADGALLANLSRVNGAIGDPAAMKRPDAATDPVGSGPYTLDKAATVNGSSYTLKKRDDYWNADAYPFETVRVKVMPDRAAVVNALRAGELTAGSVDPTQVEALRATGLRITPVKASTAVLLFLSDREGEKLEPLGDVRVRKAVNMVFDRQKIVQTFLRGAGTASTQVFNPQGQAYDPGLDKAYPFDVAAAKKLMAEAGYPDGFAVTMPGFVTTKPFEPMIAQSLGAIGVEVTWEPVPLQQQATALSSGKYPMYLGIYGLDTDAVLTRLYFSPGTPTNPFDSSDPELTKLIEQADSAADPAQSGAAYKGINRFVVENAWFAPVVDSGITWVTAKGITYLGDGSASVVGVRTFGTAD